MNDTMTNIRNAVDLGRDAWSRIDRLGGLPADRIALDEAFRQMEDTLRSAANRDGEDAAMFHAGWSAALEEVALHLQPQTRPLSEFMAEQGFRGVSDV